MWDTYITPTAVLYFLRRKYQSFCVVLRVCELDQLVTLI